MVCSERGGYSLWPIMSLEIPASVLCWAVGDAGRLGGLTRFRVSCVSSDVGSKTGSGIAST